VRGLTRIVQLELADFRSIIGGQCPVALEAPYNAALHPEGGGTATPTALQTPVLVPRK
jgi:hypothetical protein